MYDELVNDLHEISGNRAIPVHMAETAIEAADAIEKLLSRLQNAINWTSVEKDGLPLEPGEYIVYVRDGIQPDHTIPGLDGDLSYVTTAYFDPDTCLWKENDEYYNGDLDKLIDKVIAKYLEHERKGELVFAAAEVKQDIVDLISDAPVIIPAEEDEA